MKQFKKTLIALSINIILILICLTTVAFAWFSNNKNAAGTGLDITIEQNSISFDYINYYYDNENRTFEETTNFDLRAYDMIITNRNIHTAIITKLIISGQAVAGQQNITFNFLCRDNQSNTMSLSNVVSFKIGLFNISSTTAEDIYLAVEENFKDIAENKFLNTTKNIQISYTLSNYSDYVTNNQLIVYLQTDYSVSLMEQFNNLTTEDFETTISFNADIYELDLEVIG